MNKILQLSLTLATTAQILNAVAVTNWVSIYDEQLSDPRFVGSTASTASPVTTDADQDSIAAGFTSHTLLDGETIQLTGSVAFDSAYLAGQSSQFRIGLFDLTTGSLTQDAGGDNLVGIYSEAGSTSASDIKFNDGGSATIPFSSANATTIGNDVLSAGGTLVANAVLDFSLSITRTSDLLTIASSYSSGGFDSSGSVVGYDPSSLLGFTYTFDSVAFLLGGALNANAATFSDIDVTVIPEPSTSAGLLGIATLGLVFGRRRRG